MLICHLNPPSRSFTPRVKRFLHFMSWCDLKTIGNFQRRAGVMRRPLTCFTVSSQGVSLPVHQHGHHVVLHEGDGRSHHPLRPRSPGRRLRQDLQNRRERFGFGPSAPISALLKGRKGRLTSQGRGCFPVLIGFSHVCR